MAYTRNASQTTRVPTGRGPTSGLQRVSRAGGPSQASSGSATAKTAPTSKSRGRAGSKSAPSLRSPAKGRGGKHAPSLRSTGTASGGKHAPSLKSRGNRAIPPPKIGQSHKAPKARQLRKVSRPNGTVSATYPRGRA